MDVMFCFNIAVTMNHTQNYNFACCFVWVLNLVADIEGGTYVEGVGAGY
jgi:hypothetical protein